MFKKLLVPIDGSDHSNRAVDQAVELAKCCDASLYLVHVIQDLPLPKEILEMIAAGEVTATREQILQDSADLMLTNARVRCQQAGCLYVNVDVLRGDPASKILSYAEQNGIDLIVLGQRGLMTRPGLLGGVARKIVNMAGVSCLVVA